MVLVFVLDILAGNLDKVWEGAADSSATAFLVVRVGSYVDNNK